ncbi:Bug family tripartite tricarboxylate transporter substrate binding protein [Variovorax sp. Varisp85]|uniref:Bug family tripartite tricarboxylate transporter substrate binding protein n=1 Tax=Variovorax sp. Varisp85 TaxID=3243059 RepID=UPI0039A55CCD
MTIHLPRRRALLGLAAGMAAGLGNAQQPPRDLRILVGYPPGGATDVMARLIAQNMRERSIGNVIVDNRAGAGGRVALDAARRAPSDGTTVVMTPDFPLTIFPHLYRKLSYAPLTDFAPVAICGVSEFALCVGPAVPRQIGTAGDFLAWCKANPRQALYASPSPGSTPHFAGLMLARASRVDLTHVSYKGGSQAIQDLLGGQVPASINPVAEVLPYLESGRLRALATTGAERSPFLPGVPTLRESGYADVVARSWIGLLAPAGIPAAAISAMEQGVGEALRKDTVIQGFAKFGISVDLQTGGRFRAVLREDTDRWASVVKASGFTIDE